MSTSLLSLVVVALAGNTPKPTTNPLGFQYTLPTGWVVAQSQDAYQVIRRGGQTENELYVIGGQVEFEAKTSWDARLQREDEEMMQALGPWTPMGDVASFDAKSGKGMLRRFSITVEGVNLYGEIWSLVADNKRFGILAIYPSELGQRLYPRLLSIASSLRPDPNRKISANNARAREWSQRLAGHRFTTSSANNSGSLNGASGDAVDRTLVLLRDGTFQYYSRSMSFISAGQFSGSSESSDQAVGTWSVQSDGSSVFLILSPAGRPRQTVSLSMRGGQIAFDGRVATRTKL